MPRFPIPRQDCFDTNGAPRAGAKLYFYTTGTTTPLNTYADSALVTPNANPVVADSAGLFGEIFLTQTATYKVVLKTSLDVTVWTADPVPGGTTAADLTGLINAASITSDTTELQAITNKLQFLQAGAGAVTRTVQSKLRDTVSIMDFGAVDGASDNLTAIQAAVTTGKNVHIPDGDWRLSAAVSVITPGQRIIGSGGKCRISTTSATTDIFTVGNNTDIISGVSFEGLRLYSTVTKSAGAAIRFRKAKLCDVRSCGISSELDFGLTGVRLWDGIVYEEASDCVIDDCSMWGFGQDGVRIYGSAAQNAEISVTGGTWIAYAERYGVYLGGRFGGLRLSDGDISACWRNLNIDQLLTPGFPNREIFIGSQFSIDSSSDCNVFIGDQGASIFEADGFWNASAGRVSGIGPSSALGEGLHIDPGNDGLTVRWTGGRIYNCAGAGITMNEGRLLLNDVLVTDNGTGTGVADHGVWVVLAGGNNGPIQITNCYFAGNAGYDLLVEAQLEYSRITDNVFRGGGTGTYSGATNTPSVTNIIQRNIGYTTRAEGTGAILTGNTSVTISHGLAGLPSNVTLTALNTVPEGRGLAVDNITTTQFDVIISSAAVADRDFYWSANFGPYA
jgi:hypothetical protein